MNIPCSLRITALGLAFCSVALAQSPPAAPPTPPAAPAASPQVPVVTQSSRVRAFNAGPGGDVRSLYLQNGSVVDVTPALGAQLGAAVRKDERITVTGAKSEMNGQSLLQAASIRLNDQTFSANASLAVPPRSGALAQSAVPPPGTLPAASALRRNKPAVPAPCSAPPDAPLPPDFGGPPPPPPDGLAPPQG